MKILKFLLIFSLLTGCAGLSGPPNPEATDATFAALQVSVDTEASIAQKLGRPSETMALPLRDMHVWSYKYKQAGIWHSLMHIHFDRHGVVRELMSGPDPDYEDRRSF